MQLEMRKTFIYAAARHVCGTAQRQTVMLSEHSKEYPAYTNGATILTNLAIVSLSKLSVLCCGELGNWAVNTVLSRCS
jgi:hypothetical protein